MMGSFQEETRFIQTQIETVQVENEDLKNQLEYVGDIRGAAGAGTLSTGSLTNSASDR